VRAVPKEKRQKKNANRKTLVLNRGDKRFLLSYRSQIRERYSQSKTADQSRFYRPANAV
jgi:hypothetical protein